MHDVRIFGVVAHWCGQRRWWVIVAWLVVSVSLNVLVPQLERTVAEHSAAFTPDGRATAALRQMSLDFGEQPSTAVGSVVMSREDGPLTAGDRLYAGAVVERLRAERGDVAYVLDTVATPGLESVSTSPDGHALHVILATTGDVGSTRAHQSILKVRSLVAELPRPPGLDAHVTGPAPALADVFSAIDTSLLIITAVSVLLITTILLLVYRSLATALIPLLTVGISLGVARPVISLLGSHDALTVSNFTIALMTAMVLGAGTDYGIFLLSSYHEGRRAGIDVDEAVTRAGSRTAGIVIASALTIAGAGLAMVFTKVGMFRAAGPPIAIGVALTVAVSLTLTPALLALWGRYGRAEPRPLNARRWRRRGARIIRRAPAVIATSLAVLLASSAVLLTARPNIDENAMQIRATDSRTGYQKVADHWQVNEAAPEFLIVRADHDMRNTKDLAALELVASAVSKLPEVAYVRFLTRPDGRPLAQTAVGYQTGIVGDGLSDAQHRVESVLPQLRQLASGVNQISAGASGAADRIPELARGVESLLNIVRTLLPILQSADRMIATATSGTFDVASLVKTMSVAVTSLRATTDAVNAAHAQSVTAATALHTVFDPVTSPEPPPSCDATCARARQAFAEFDAATSGRASAALGLAQLGAPLVPQDAFDTTMALLPDLDVVLEGASSLLQQLGGQPPDVVRARLNTLSSGVSDLTTGLTRLSHGLNTVKAGTDSMVGLTDQLNDGLTQAAGYLKGLSEGTTDGAGRGFYLPAEAQRDARIAAGSALLLSPDGRTARMMVVWSVNPYGPQAIAAAPLLASTAQNTVKGTTLAEARVEGTGLTSISADHLDQTWRDFTVFGLTAVIAVLIILVVMLRSLVAPVVMIAAVVVSFGAAAGLSTLIWQHVVGIDLDWSVLPVSFMALVAVGADYSMLFAARIREESATGTLSGIIKGFASTGSVITTAGLVFAITMFALTTGTVLNLVQIGSTIGLGLLLNITIVRTYLIPATMAVLGDHMWWPAASPHGPARRAINGLVSQGDGATSSTP